MNARGGFQERAYRALLRAYPTHFRARFADEMVQLFGDLVRDARGTSRPAAPARLWLRTFWDLALTAPAEHGRERTVAQSLTLPPTNATRALGILGILGGVVLLAPFLPFINIDVPLNQVRLGLFGLGAMAIIVGVHRRQASISPRLALLGAIPAFIANAWYVAMVLLMVGRTSPFSGEFGFVSFVAGMTMWFADGVFGLVTLRIGAASRWGALALTMGSLAVVGMDRLGLVDPAGANPNLFGSIALAGIALNGLGWVLLGLDVVLRRRPIAGLPAEGQGAEPPV